ncbi:MAG: peroxiredoxin family protein, partial [Planctomycetota bacterium]
VPDFIKKHGITYGVVAHGSMARLWGVSGVPDAFLISPEGTVVWHGHPATLTTSYLEQTLGTGGGSHAISTGPASSDDESSLWLYAVFGAFIFFAGAMGFFWWRTRTPKWKPDYGAYAPQQPEQAPPVPPQGAPAEGQIGAAQAVHVGQTRDFANTSIVSRMEFNESSDSEHMGGGHVTPTNTISKPGTGTFVRPSTGSTPAVPSGPHSKPKLNRSSGHLGAAATNSSSPHAAPYPGSAPQQQPYPGSAPQQQPYPGSNPQAQPYPGSAPQQQPYPGSNPQAQPYPGSAPQQQPHPQQAPSGPYPQQPPAGQLQPIQPQQQPYPPQQGYQQPQPGHGQPGQPAPHPQQAPSGPYPQQAQPLQPQPPQQGQPPQGQPGQPPQQGNTKFRPYDPNQGR